MTSFIVEDMYFAIKNCEEVLEGACKDQKDDQFNEVPKFHTVEEGQKLEVVRCNFSYVSAFIESILRFVVLVESLIFSLQYLKASGDS